MNQSLKAIPNEQLLQESVKSTCPYCGVGCGVEVSTTNTGVVVNGDKYHPANFGKLCIKGKNLGLTVDNDNRLSTPMVNGGAQSWPRALDYVASEFNKTIEKYGKDSVAFYVSGQLLTEDYYVANKLMKGFIGTGNIDTNSRLCMSSAVAAHKQVFGEDIVPMSYSDITSSDVIVLAGSNLAWCHPVIYQRIREEKERRPALKIIVIDPRATASLELADLHLPIKPGGDLILFNSLLDFMAQRGQLDLSLPGMKEALAAAQISAASIGETGLDDDLLAQFFTAFSDSDKVVTLFSQGINQSTQGTKQVSAILNCHVASGKIGRQGCGPFSITGQPNAMGGREVGALANTLAAHMEFDNTELLKPLSEFWQTDNLATSAGLKAVELFDAIKEGKIKAVWIMATNPLVSLPNHDAVRQALEACPLVVVSDCVASNDTLDYANVILPAQGWGEKSGTVTNSERRISRQRSFLEPYGDAKADWWIVCEVAKRMGFAKQFTYDGPADIFKEHARLSGLENNGTRGFDISQFGNISEQQYQQWLPVQWPQPKGSTRRLSDQLFFGDNQYFHQDKQPRIKENSHQSRTFDADLFVLNTGRNRDQWHTQTRSGKASKLTNHQPEPLVEINSDDGKKLGLVDGGLAQLSGQGQSLIARIKLSHKQLRGSVFMPIHWSQSNSNQGCVSKLVAPVYDPTSGQPAFKQSQISVVDWSVNSNAILVVREPLAQELCSYQVEQRIEGGYCYYLASELTPEKMQQQLVDFIGSEHGSTIVANDPKAQYFRQHYFDEGQLEAGIFVAKTKDELPQGWVSDFYKMSNDNSAKRSLLSSDVAALQQQKTFCQCLNIAVGDIKAAIDSGELDIAKIREKTGAGGGCGSCISDIAMLLSDTVPTILVQENATDLCYDAMK